MNNEYQVIEFEANKKDGFEDQDFKASLNGEVKIHP